MAEFRTVFELTEAITSREVHKRSKEMLAAVCEEVLDQIKTCWQTD